MASVFANQDLDHVIEVPRGFFKRPFGFSLDIGGSCAKLAYYDDNDHDNDAKTTKIHLMLFKEDETGIVCKHLMRRFLLPGNPDWADHVVYTTGIGGSQYIKIFKEKLGVTIKNLHEMACFTKAFKTLLDTLDRDKFVIEKSEEAVAKGMELFEIHKMTAKEWLMAPKSETKSTVNSSVGNYPCGICIMGSAGGLLKVDESSELCSVISTITEAGRAFIGIGSLLTGKKDYGEILEAAERGSLEGASIMTTDFKVQENGEDSYNILNKMPKLPIFVFGKAAGKTVGDFKPEDLARAWVHMFTKNLTENIPFVAREAGLKHVYFIGNFFNHKLIRDDVTEAMLSNFIGKVKGDVPFDFVRYGGHYGSIGALMEDNLSEEFDVTLRLKQTSVK